MVCHWMEQVSPNFVKLGSLQQTCRSAGGLAALEKSWLFETTLQLPSLLATIHKSPAFNTLQETVRSQACTFVATPSIHGLGMIHVHNGAVVSKQLANRNENCRGTEPHAKDQHCCTSHCSTPLNRFSLLQSPHRVRHGFRL